MKWLRFMILVVLLVQGVVAQGAEVWEASHGPEGGSVAAFVSDGATLYVGTDGGVSKSVDKGVTWTAVNNGLTDKSVQSLALAPDGMLYVGTSSGVFRSVDKGGTWSAANSGLTDKLVWSLALVPDGTLYAGTLDGGIFRSADKGATWAAANRGLASTDVKVLALAPDGTLYAGTTSGGVFRSVDKGATWTAANSGLTDTKVQSLVLASDGTLYVGTWGGVFRSVDKGVTWTAANSGLTEKRVLSLVFAPDGTLYAGTWDGVFRSVNKGTSWSAANSGLTDTGVYALALAPDGALYAGTTSSGVLRSVDKGATWAAANSGLTNTQVQSLALAPDATLYAGTYGGGVFRSADKGVTWTAANSGLTEKTVPSLVFAPDGTLYAGTWWGGVFRSTDKGATWTAANSGLTDKRVKSLALAPDGTLYAGTYAGGVFRSADKGATWTAANSGLTGEYARLALAPDGTLYAGTSGGVFRSVNKGGAWTAANSGLTGTQVQSLALAPDGTLYVGTDGGVFRSVDKSASWSAANNGLTSAYVASLAIAADGTLYAGTDGSGVFRSSDKGATWTTASSGLTDKFVLSLALAPDGTLYAGTLGGGAQRMIRSAGKLTGLTLQSSSSLSENTSSLLQALALYDNGYRDPVKPTWSVDNPAAASIAADGALTALPVTQDTLITVTATYSENGVTQSASRQVLVKNIPAALTALILTVPASVPSEGSATLAATARYADGATSAVKPTWQVSGPAAINADGLLVAQKVSLDTPVTLTATFQSAGVTKTAVATLMVKKPAAKAKYMLISGPTELTGGQRATYRAKVVYEDGSETPVTPTWTSPDPASPISVAGELQAADKTQLINLIANYNDSNGALATNLAVAVTQSSGKNVLRLKVGQVGTFGTGDSLTVDLSQENFSPLTRYDLYAAVSIPGDTLIWLNDSGDVFGLPGFLNQAGPYRAHASLEQGRKPLLNFTLPAGLPAGAYTFYAVAVKEGGAVTDPAAWMSLPSPDAKPGLTSARVIVAP